MTEEKKKEKKKISLKEIGMDKLVLIAVAGIALVVLSFPSQSPKNNRKEDAIKETIASTKEYNVTLEEKLEDIIGKINGVEKATVMITLRSSSEKIVLKDSPYESSKLEENSGSDSVNEENHIYSDTSVLITDEDGGTSPYIIKELEPEILGVAVIYSGKTSSQTTYKITSIIQALFELEAHKISVIEE